MGKRRDRYSGRRLWPCHNMRAPADEAIDSEGKGKYQNAQGGGEGKGKILKVGSILGSSSGLSGLVEELNQLNQAIKQIKQINQ